MRRNNFLIGGLVALVTFISLSAFVGHRHYGWQRGWRNDRCENHHRNHYDNRNNDHNRNESDTTNF